MSFVSNWLIPIIKVVFIGGIAGYISFIVGKAIHNAWTKQFKFVVKYKILRKKMPDEKVKWILDAIDEGIGWYDAKKLLMIKMYPQQEINELLWIYDEIIKELKGGQRQNGKDNRGIESNVKIQARELPKFSTE